MAAASGGFGLDFHRGMLYAERLNGIPDILDDVVDHGRVFDYDVDSHGRFRRAHCPYVEMVHAFDSVGLKDCLPHFFKIDVGGDSVESEAQAFTQHGEGGYGNEDGDGYADDGVDDIPSREGNDQAGDHDPDGYERIGGHMKECP